MQGYLNKQISGLKYPPQTDITLRKTIVIWGKTMDEEKWKDSRLHTWVLQAKGPTQNRESPLLQLVASKKQILQNLSSSSENISQGSRQDHPPSCSWLQLKDSPQKNLSLSSSKRDPPSPQASEHPQKYL